MILLVFSTYIAKCFGYELSTSTEFHSVADELHLLFSSHLECSLYQVISRKFQPLKLLFHCLYTLKWFRVKKGVRQGCVLSPYLFNILPEMVMRETLDGFHGGLQIGGRMITNLRYADDIIQLATSEAEL